MNEAEETLKAILDLLGDWRNENGVGSVTVYITENGAGIAYDLDPDGDGIKRSRHEVRGNYGAWKAEGKEDQDDDNTKTGNDHTGVYRR